MIELSVFQFAIIMLAAILLGGVAGALLTAIHFEEYLPPRGGSLYKGPKRAESGEVEERREDGPKR